MIGLTLIVAALALLLSIFSHLRLDTHHMILRELNASLHGRPNATKKQR
jgi:hypothetical protein